MPGQLIRRGFFPPVLSQHQQTHILQALRESIHSEPTPKITPVFTPAKGVSSISHFPHSLLSVALGHQPSRASPCK